MTLTQLNTIKQQFAKNISDRKIHQEASFDGKYQVLVCLSTGCISNQSANVLERFRLKVKEANIQDKVDVVPTGCHGLCEMGPVVIIYPQGAFYAKVKVEDVDRIVNEQLVNHKVVTDKLF
jgi:NADH-quinone oxidoreductase subunit F/NADP-reducing hydrogenase subunit HndC